VWVRLPETWPSDGVGPEAAGRRADGRRNHVHVVLTADRDPEVVRDQFKKWDWRKLSDAADLSGAVAKGTGRRHWFSERRDAEIVDTENGENENNGAISRTGGKVENTIKD
jgi:hypothetical protein